MTTFMATFMSNGVAAPASSIPASAYTAVIAGGAVVVDIRTHAQRAAEGALPGALAIAADLLEARLDPSSSARLGVASDPRVRWVLISDDGTLASMAVQALHLLGVRNASHVDGGFLALERRGLVAAGDSAAHVRREAAAITAH
ncbi:rhodanese-like domain-containing protein [Tomitella fengzijianii]|uniref:Rhodanese-like domain-containing protein n=1 Tax=Tomitella fengzijianii TaxID=2597660 RepID=A0A516X0B2_9ACTN|nr:rhodanese-like domain-containing protein [Tomitella fengzijianii]QDQ96493.1 rhodanese-like domain-containing protein [Tomitella fengzijianii]